MTTHRRTEIFLEIDDDECRHERAVCRHGSFGEGKYRTQMALTEYESEKKSDGHLY